MKRKKKIPVLFPSEILGAVTIGQMTADPFGSYTGVSQDPLEKPVQDADDL